MVRTPFPKPKSAWIGSIIDQVNQNLDEYCVVGSVVGVVNPAIVTLSTVPLFLLPAQVLQVTYPVHKYCAGLLAKPIAARFWLAAALLQRTVAHC